MYNTFVYNTQVYNAPNNLFSFESLDPIIFNDYSLQNAEIVSFRLLEDSTPERDLAINNIPRNDGQYIIGDYWRKKIIKVQGYIKKPTSDLLEAEIDKMKKALAVREANLDITKGGVTKRYKATLVNGPSMFDGREHFHVTFIPFSVEFLCVEPFGHSLLYDAFTIYDETDLTLNESINNVGTIRAKPIVILNFTSATNVTGITFTNNTRGESISINETINVNDYIRFDSENLEVTINAIPVDYDGSFPLLNTDANSISIDIDGDAATYTYTGKYLIPYL